MSRLKIANAVKDIEVKETIRIIQCPHCYTFLKGIGTATIVMRCWSCNKEFRVQQDHAKWSACDEPALVQLLWSKDQSMSSTNNSIQFK